MNHFFGYILALNRYRSYQTDFLEQNHSHLYNAEPRSFEPDKASNPTTLYYQHVDQYPSIWPFQKNRLYHPLATISVAHHMHLYVAKIEYGHFSIDSYQLNSMNGALAPKTIIKNSVLLFFVKTTKGVCNILSL